MGWIICICPNARRKYRMVKLKSSPNFIQSRIHFQLQFTFILPVPWLQPPPNLLIKENWWDNHRYDLQMELALRIWSNLLLVSQKAKKIYARICTTTYLVLLICQPYILIKVRAQEGIDFYINARKSFRNSIKKTEKKTVKKEPWKRKYFNTKGSVHEPKKNWKWCWLSHVPSKPTLEIDVGDKR